MNAIRPSRPNAYTGSPLDRASTLREDEAWVAGQLMHEASLFVPLWRARNLVTGEAGPEAVILEGRHGQILLGGDAAWALLGRQDGRAVFAIDLGLADDPPAPIPDGARFEDLRQLAGALPEADAAILSHARGLMHWRARHRFCGVCGRDCTPRSAGNAMQCGNCGTQHFPRTDPAVIMLVTKGDRALLGHSARFPNARMYSTLAGFVEPGESLEEAVAREVREETGVVVGEVYYHSSQPWPFPASIMLGFHAEAASEAITIDPDELTDARWFTRAEIADPETNGFMLPRRDSIARRLIEDWAAA